MQSGLIDWESALNVASSGNRPNVVELALNHKVVVIANFGLDVVDVLTRETRYKVVVSDRAGWKPWFTIVEKDKYVTHDEDGFLQEKNATASSMHVS